MAELALPPADGTALPLWRLVPLADYAAPVLPARSAATLTWASLRQWLSPRDPAADTPAKREDELRALSQLRLAHLVQPIDWAAAAQPLAGPADAGAQDAVRFLVGQPHCGHAAMVEAWAARHGALLIEPPAEQALLGGRWRRPWPASGQPWALPRLERFFLRHADGLGPVRALLEDMASGRAGIGLVGCDSWAWAYLQRVWPLAQPAVLTLQAFGAAELARLFGALAQPRRRGRLLFRNARTGRETLAEAGAGEAASVSQEIEQLAAHCRGNVGIARSYWREALCAEPEAEVAEAAAAELADLADLTDAEATGQGDEVIWVRAVLGERALPLEGDEEPLLLLHALLLHGGLIEDLLPELLPLPRHRCLAMLHKLRAQGVVLQVDGRWQVDALAYALVRRLLRGRDFLVDAF